MRSETGILEPVNIDTVKTCVNGKPDDLFVCWASPEERCKGSVSRLHGDYRAEHCIVIRYSDHENEKREKHVREMENTLGKVSKVEEMEIDESRPIPLIRDLCERMERLVHKRSQPRITLDMSTPIKWHLLILLKFLDLRNLLECVRFLYTEPEDYVTDLFQSLSFGIKEIFPIPTYHGDYDFSKGDLLVLMLGYEGSRAVSLYDDVDPSECLLLVPDPPYHREWKGRTEAMNQEIIGIAGTSKIRYLHSRNPMKVAFQLDSILSAPEYTEYNHVISPLGTKPQTLGLYSYLSTHPANTIVEYGAPLRHNDLFYSTGIGPTWELPFQKLGAGKWENLGGPC